MWPFSKKYFPPLNSLPAEEEWSVAQGIRNGKPMILRVNSSAKAYKGHPLLPARMGIAIPLYAPDTNGLPENAEAVQLSVIEDRLFDAISASGRVVLVITTSGMREFVSYLRSVEDAEAVAQRVRSATTTHEIQHYAGSDPTWTLFRDFT